MKKELVYQIMCVGSTQLLGEHKTIYSKSVYRHYPTQEEIDAFVKRCTTPMGELDFVCLDEKETIETKVVELEIFD